jgi:FkbM family methyltransferase
MKKIKRVLFLPLEFQTWDNARYWSYPACFGLEDGFDSCEIDYMTVPLFFETPYTSKESFLLKLRTYIEQFDFDMVLFTANHTNVDDEFYKWIKSVAPVICGFLTESITITDEEWKTVPKEAQERKARVDKALENCTHMVVVDEKDLIHLAEKGIPSFLWRGSIPEKFILTDDIEASFPNAIFYGAVYGKRQSLLESKELKKLITRPKISLEYGSEYPKLFDETNQALLRDLNESEVLPDPESIIADYHETIKLIRQRNFELWLRSLQQGSSIVNLPQNAGFYSSRVYEGIAAGRPVIASRIDDRPLNENIFEEGKEILHFSPDNQKELADHIKSISKNPEYAKELVINAQNKLRKFHTTELRMNEFIQWLEKDLPNKKEIDNHKNIEVTEQKIELPLQIQEGDLVFDVGANLGAKTEEYLACGARVVCFEPQPNCVSVLEQKFSKNPNVTIVPAGLSDKKGKLELSICSEAPTISTFSEEWKQGRFADYNWDQKVTVDVITLDQAIKDYGVPDYIKVDVEGFELSVLKGLKKPVPFVSFEFTCEFFSRAQEIMGYLQSIGYKHFTYAFGEDRFMSIDQWLSANDLANVLQNSEDKLLWGDIYAHFDSEVTEQIERPKSISNNTYADLLNQNIISESKPIKLHLGCGEQYFDGYVNIDYPTTEHNVMDVKADYFATITDLNFPDNSVDEIRLHHVFEHFPRVTALSLLIKWQKWLKVGGKLHIETPDFLGSAETMLSEVPWKVKTGVIRHIAGDQSAPWAYHIDQWFPERFERTFKTLGFDNVEIEQVKWPHEPFLSNVHAIGIKKRVIDEKLLLKEAENILWESTVADAEKATHDVWCQQLHDVYYGNLVLSPNNTASPKPSVQNIPEMKSASDLPIAEIHDFNQRSRDKWIIEKAKEIPEGAIVLDVGAGTCPYKELFNHCNYKSHDFKQYEGEKLGGGSEYGEIDYVSDIVHLPLNDGSVDVVLCTEVLEHVPNPTEALKELIRIVKPGGQMILTAHWALGCISYHFTIMEDILPNGTVTLQQNMAVKLVRLRQMVVSLN